MLGVKIILLGLRWNKKRKSTYYLGKKSLCLFICVVGNDLCYPVHCCTARSEYEFEVYFAWLEAIQTWALRAAIKHSHKLSGSNVMGPLVTT
jgi:hypothetical protein